ncbi:hypothetical protein Pcinc_033229 [Petrolisthes cinctipes]|uniref:Uncharacterized protein n=1 Tax=Petrolisthes cinctipes TaxID=88211 RepID=A0AAE1ESP2_PETCI|nr:hypothetical protein Pcinc_033229 [Petrolisthes cinctipes]
MGEDGEESATTRGSSGGGPRGVHLLTCKRGWMAWAGWQTWPDTLHPSVHVVILNRIASCRAARPLPAAHAVDKLKPILRKTHPAHKQTTIVRTTTDEVHNPPLRRSEGGGGWGLPFVVPSGHRNLPLDLPVYLHQARDVSSHELEEPVVSHL